MPAIVGVVRKQCPPQTQTELVLIGILHLGLGLISSSPGSRLGRRPAKIARTIPVLRSRSTSSQKVEENGIGLMMAGIHVALLVGKSACWALTLLTFLSETTNMDRVCGASYSSYPFFVFESCSTSSETFLVYSCVQRHLLS
jgi:hypothetical protein